MLEPEIAALRDALMKVGTTPDEGEATRWARKIVEALRDAGYDINYERTHDPR